MRVACQNRSQDFPPLGKSYLTQVEAVEVRKIENKVNDVGCAGPVKGVLQCAEVGDALVIQYDNLAIQPARGNAGLRDSVHQRRELCCPVMAVAREAGDRIAINSAQEPVAVELDLVQPWLRPGRRGVQQGGQLRSQFGGQCGFAGALGGVFGISGSFEFFCCRPLLCAQCLFCGSREDTLLGLACGLVGGRRLDR